MHIYDCKYASALLFKVALFCVRPFLQIYISKVQAVNTLYTGTTLYSNMLPDCSLSISLHFWLLPACPAPLCYAALLQHQHLSQTSAFTFYLCTHLPFPVLSHQPSHHVWFPLVCWQSTALSVEINNKSVRSFSSVTVFSCTWVHLFVCVGVIQAWCVCLFHFFQMY